MPLINPSKNFYKATDTANPLSPNIFCADPTSVEFEGRLYVYGTNDHQQYEAVGDAGKNSYEHIKSLVVFSTGDMVNWEYHGIINTAAIAPWIINSWAPSIVSRVEADGRTHFYLYFSNNGHGVGVITATHPLGPWSDPLGKPLVYQDMAGLENCPAPFDPGALIDENGVGWLSFGGGTPARGDAIYTKVPKIVRLGPDLLSFDSGFVTINAPYFFEASELNQIDGTFVYSYSTDWQGRDGWTGPEGKAPAICSMGYMTSKTPLDGDSWEFKGGFFLNAGDSGMEWCNNHTHLMEYGGTKYILHHTMHIQDRTVTKGGFRCMCVDYLPWTAESLPLARPTRQGVQQIKALDPFRWHSGAEMFTCADIGYGPCGNGKVAAIALTEGSWTMLKGVDFGSGTNELALHAAGNGEIQIRLDGMDSRPVAVAGAARTTVKTNVTIKGVHDLYFVFADKDIRLESWMAQ